MNSKYTHLFLIALVLLAIGILSVSCTLTSPIVGKWQEANGDITEFTWNGRITVYSERSVLTGTYEIVGGDYLKVKFDGIAGAFSSFFGTDTMKYRVSGDGSILQIAQGRQTRMLWRVRNSDSINK